MLWKTYLLQRLQQPLAGIAYAAGQDDGFRIEDGGVVSQSASQHLSRAAVGLDGQSVALVAQFGNHLGRQVLHLSHQAGLTALFHQFLCGEDDALVGAVGLQASLVAASAHAAVGHDACVAHLTGKPLVAQVYLAVGEEATAHAVAEGDDDKVLHAVGGTEGLLAECCTLRVVAYGDGQPQPVAHEGGQRDDALPCQVGRVLDASR